MKKICPKHKNYKAIARPRVHCAACWWMWIAKHPTKITLQDLYFFKISLMKDKIPKEWEEVKEKV